MQKSLITILASLSMSMAAYAATPERLESFKDYREPLFELPDGCTVRDYVTTNWQQNSLFGFVRMPGEKAQIAFSADGKYAYFNHILTGGLQMAWVEAEIQENGDMIIKPGQFVCYDEDGYPLYLMPTYLQPEDDRSWFITEAVVKKVSTGSIDEVNGNTIENLNDMYTSPRDRYIICDIDDESDFNKFSDWLYLAVADDTFKISSIQTATHLNEFVELDAPVSVPEDAVCQDYILYSNDGVGGTVAPEKIQAYTKGDDVWVKGLSRLNVNQTIAGKIKDGKWEIPSLQMIDCGAYVYQIFATKNCTPAYNDKLLSYTFQSTPEKTIVLSPYTEGDRSGVRTELGVSLVSAKVNSYYDGETCQEEVKLREYLRDEPLMPSAPTGAMFYNNATAIVGYNYFSFYLSELTPDKDYLNTDKLYYKIYLNGEPFVFRKEDYPRLQEDMEMLPFNYSQSGVATSSPDIDDAKVRTINVIYPLDNPLDIKEWGVSAVYVVDGIETETDLVTGKFSRDPEMVIYPPICPRIADGEKITAEVDGVSKEAYRFMVRHENIDVNGDELSRYSLKLKVYVDGEPYLFLPQYYPFFAMPMSSVSYDCNMEDFIILSDLSGTRHVFGVDKSTYDCHIFTIFDMPEETIGVQMVYSLMDEEVPGEIRTVNVNNPQWDDLTTDYTGINTIDIYDSEVVREEYYSLDGKLLREKPMSGIYILRQTLANGAVKNMKRAGSF